MTLKTRVNVQLAAYNQLQPSFKTDGYQFGGLFQRAAADLEKPRFKVFKAQLYHWDVSWVLRSLYAALLCGSERGVRDLRTTKDTARRRNKQAPRNNPHEKLERVM